MSSSNPDTISPLAKLKALLTGSKYAKNILTLMTGTVASQAIPIVASPVLSRLYDPKEFGLLALYMSITMTASITATGRYEQAIVLPEKEDDSLNLVLLALVLSGMFSLTLFGVVCFWAMPVLNFYHQSAFTTFAYLVPISIFTLSVYQAFYYWFNRNGSYKILTNSKIIASLAVTLLQLLLYRLGNNGLVLGYIVGQFVATLFLILCFIRDIKSSNIQLAINQSKILVQARRYAKFPQYLLVGHTLNSLSGNMPVFLLSTFFGAGASGLYSLTSRVIVTPMLLIGIATSDVFRERASKDFARTGRCDAIFVKTFKLLLAISVVPSIVFFFVAPSLFPFLFGQKWVLAGHYAQLLTPMFFFHFITIPLCSMFIIAEKQEMDLLWQIVRAILSVTSVFVGYHYFHSDTMAILLFSLSFGLLYGASGIMGYRFSLGK
jgi:O-antigen/teichoic acid export membrane protein